jgi:hypothetical protein
MRALGWLLALSAGLLVPVLGLGAVARVRIDARARIESARSLRERARLSQDPRDWRLCGETYVSVLRAYSPFDLTPRAALAELGEPLRLLPLAPALALVDAAVAEVDSLALLTVPLAAEREDLVSLRGELLERHRRAARPAEDSEHE